MLDFRNTGVDFDSGRPIIEVSKRVVQDSVQMEDQLEKTLKELRGVPTQSTAPLDQPVRTVRDVLELLRRYAGGGGSGQQGPAGPEGPAGPQGEQGEEGPQGEQGPQGVQGEQGIQGATGPTGATGPAGADGVVQSIVAGTGITVDDTDPANPVVNATGGGSGGYFNGMTYAGGTLAMSTDTYATKGSPWIPDQDVVVTHLIGQINPAGAGDVYTIGIASLTTGGTISSVLGTATLSPGGPVTSIVIRAALSSPVPISAGARVLLFISRTDSTGTTAARIYGGPGTYLNSPGEAPQDRYHYNTTTLAAAQVPSLSQTNQRWCIWPEGSIQ